MLALQRFSKAAAVALCALSVSGCAFLSTTGPSTKAIQSQTPAAGEETIQVVDVSSDIARRLLAQRRQYLFSETFGLSPAPDLGLGPGDGVEIDVWEAPPAALFASGSTDTRTVAPGARPTLINEQMVDREGYISVPFIGKIKASGQTLAALADDVGKRLTGKANQPQVSVRLTKNRSSSVTVIGEVTGSIKFPLTPGGERLLDALAAAGGVRQPINKMTLQLTRGSEYHSLPMDTVIRDPQQNVPLRAGDVITAIFQPLSFTALGATGKNEEVSFEAQGITLAQALARSGGLLDSRSDARGLFIFRFEPESALDWPRRPVAVTPDGRVPVIYRVDLQDPASFFVMQSFAVNNGDILYVSNAPAAELQKFLNLIFSVAYPLLTTVQVSK